MSACHTCHRLSPPSQVSLPVTFPPYYPPCYTCDSVTDTRTLTTTVESVAESVGFQGLARPEFEGRDLLFPPHHSGSSLKSHKEIAQ